MWTCPGCNEQHEDQFKECWKCAAVETRMSEKPLPQPRTAERTLRSNSSILGRMAVAFFIGLILGGALSFSLFLPIAAQLGFDPTGTSSASLLCGSITGAGFAVLVGLFFWVLFPYEPTPTLDIPPGDETSNEQGT